MRTSPALSCFGEPRPPWRGDACIRVRGLVPGDGSPEGVGRSLDAGQSPALLCVVCRQLVSSLRVVLFRRRRGGEALESDAFVTDMSAWRASLLAGLMDRMPRIVYG